MNTSNALLLTQLILQLTQQLQAAGSILVKAQTEGRDVTDEERDAVRAADVVVEKRVDQLIANAGG